ncbi:phage portal protein [Granulicella sp. 5B5]|uniref:phage portal protein n=1 Tax=Granulicella sp. 5B5 TaxID=1617967 RepID=UPI002107B856|nr:phage portal protein [Granulicella sp. 5B5]
MWERMTDVEAAADDVGSRKTLAAPLGLNSIFAPFRGSGVQHQLPKPTAANLRRFAETPAARRAINCIKDKIACMEWRIEARPGLPEDPNGDRELRAAALMRSFETPNDTDSFRTLIEQVIEDTLIGGFGAAEVEITGDDAAPVRLYPVDGATIQVNSFWDGDPGNPRYAQLTSRPGSEKLIPLRDDQLMYVKLNPRTHTVFGLGKMEVAFESITQFLQSHRYAARLASNSVVQYALWLNKRTPEQHERLIRWWQDEVEGTGRVPVLSSEQKPEVLRFAGGTDADLRLQWQEFLLTMIANAFDLPSMLLGVTQNVNRSTAQELANEAFQNAVVPLAKLIAEHLTRDVIAKRLGWNDLRFVWSELGSRDEQVELSMQLDLLKAGVISVAEVRSQRGLPAVAEPAAL